MIAPGMQLIETYHIKPEFPASSEIGYCIYAILCFLAFLTFLLFLLCRDRNITKPPQMLIVSNNSQQRALLIIKTSFRSRRKILLARYIITSLRCHKAIGNFPQSANEHVRGIFITKIKKRKKNRIARVLQLLY